MFALLKLAIVTAVAWFDLARQGAEILNCGQLPLPELATFVVQIVIWTALRSAPPYWCWRFSIMPTSEFGTSATSHDPRRDAGRAAQLQGDPRTASRRRGLWRQMASGGAMAPIAP